MKAAESDAPPITLDAAGKATTVIGCEENGDPPKAGVRDEASGETNESKNKTTRASNTQLRAKERIDTPPL